MDDGTRDDSIRRARPQCAHGSRLSDVRGGAGSPVGAGGNTPVVYACAHHAASIGSTSHRFEPDPAPIVPRLGRIHCRRNRGLAGLLRRRFRIAWLLGPTGGYIWGFLFAAPLVGILALWLGQRWSIVAALAGIAVIYVLGWYHLSQWYFLVRDEQSPWMLAYRNGVEPFVLIDIAKAVVAVGLVYGGTRLGLSLPGAKK